MEAYVRFRLGHEDNVKFDSQTAFKPLIQSIQLHSPTEKEAFDHFLSLMQSKTLRDNLALSSETPPDLIADIETVNHQVYLNIQIQNKNQYVADVLTALIQDKTINPDALSVNGNHHVLLTQIKQIHQQQLEIERLNKALSEFRPSTELQKIAIKAPKPKEDQPEKKQPLSTAFIGNKLGALFAPKKPNIAKTESETIPSSTSSSDLHFNDNIRREELPGEPRLIFYYEGKAPIKMKMFSQGIFSGSITPSNSSDDSFAEGHGVFMTLNHTTDTERFEQFFSEFTKNQWDLSKLKCVQIGSSTDKRMQPIDQTITNLKQAIVSFKHPKEKNIKIIVPNIKKGISPKKSHDEILKAKVMEKALGLLKKQVEQPSYQAFEPLLKNAYKNYILCNHCIYYVNTKEKTCEKIDHSTPEMLERLRALDDGEFILAEASDKHLFGHGEKSIEDRMAEQKNISSSNSAPSTLLKSKLKTVHQTHAHEYTLYLTQPKLGIKQAFYWDNENNQLKYYSADGKEESWRLTKGNAMLFNTKINAWKNSQANTAPLSLDIKQMNEFLKKINITIEDQLSSNIGPKKV